MACCGRVLCNRQRWAETPQWDRVLTSTYSAQQLRSAFKGNHMLSSLPALPDRKYLGETHLAPYLIDDRQSVLWSTALHGSPFVFVASPFLEAAYW